MTNPEGPAGDEFQDDFSKFMDEFGELDQELDLKTTDVADETLQVQFDSRMDEIRRLIDAKGITRLAQGDEDRQSELFRYYIDTWKAARSSDHEGEFAVDAVVAYYDERDFQQMAIEAAAMLTCKLEDRHIWNSDALEVYAAKKELQAMFIVNYDRDTEDAWYKLFDELVPTEGLDMARPGDEQYIITAHEGTRHFHNELLKRRMVLTYAFEIIGVDIDTTTTAALEAITSLVIEMRIAAEAPVVSERELIERRVKLAGYASHLFLDQDKLEELLALYDAAYPPWVSFPYGYGFENDEEDEEEQY
jgi:hypothetical protein